MVLIALLVVCPFACKHRGDPQAALNHARETLDGGDIAAALREADKDYLEFHSFGPEWAWNFALLKAQALNRQGKSEETLKLLSSEPGAPPTAKIAIKRYWLEGLAYTSLHKFAEAEQRFRETDPLCSGGGPPICADVSTARGTLEMQRGNYSDAQSFFARVLDRARAEGDQLWVADALLDISWSAEEQTHFDEAIDRANRAREIGLEHGFAGVVQKATGNMGWAFYKLGDFDKGEQMLHEAERQAATLGNMTDQLKWLLDVGYIYFDRGDFDGAQKAYLESYELAKKINSPEDIINGLQALAFVSEQTNKLDDAKHYADEALRMAREDGNKRDETYPLLVQGRIAAQQHDPVAAQNALEEVVDSKDSPVFLKWEAQHSLARLYEDEHQNEAASREYRAALSTFEVARSELQHENTRLPFLTNATHIYDDYIHFLVSRGKTDEALQAAEYSRARTLSEGLGFLKKTVTFQPDPLNTAQIARRVGGSIFFYSLGEKQSYLWLVTAQKTTLFPLPPAPEIDAAVRRYREALLRSQDPLETSNTDAIALYRTLIAPAISTLPKKNTRVFIIPDGTLYTLNFETLIVPDPTPHYWIEDVTLADASSLRLLATLRPAVAHSLQLLMMGDAVAPNADYPQLQKASAEMESIGKHFIPAQQKLFTREQATPAAYLSNKPEQFSYIHFVAHGTASRTNPLDSAIVLSRATKEDDSFKLYARDIIHHNLRADLVTISTCYGSGSRAYSGEGLVGLSWAFLRAGAHNVIGALWEVSDVSTPRLMDQLYGDLKNGQRSDTALRAAKLSLLHSNTPFRKPLYWAPFQLYTGS